MATASRRISCRMLSMLLFSLLGALALRAQSVPCLVGRGLGPNGWVREDDSAVGRMLRTADALRNDSAAQLTEVYRNVIAAAENLSDNDTCKARALFYAAFYFGGLDAEKGLVLEKRSVAIDDSALPAGHPRRVLDLRDLAGFYDRASKPTDASRLYDQVLSLVGTTQGLSAMERMFTYAGAAGFYDRQKNFARAEALYRQALDASQQLQPSMRVWPLNMRADLARVLAEEGKQDEAHALLNEPTAPIPAPPVPGASASRPDLSAPLADLARASQYVSEGNARDAEAAYLSAISALEKLNHPAATRNLMAALGGLGGLYHQQQRDPEAEAAYLRAFRIWETEASRAGTKRVAPPVLQPLMTMYKDEGRLTEIEPLYLRAIDLQERLPERDDFGVSIMLTDLAFIYRQENKYEAALPLYQRILSIEEAKWGRDDPKLASILDQYAETLEKLNRGDEAAAIRARSVRLITAGRHQ